MHVQRPGHGQQRRADRAGTTTQVDNHRIRDDQAGREANEQFGPAARNEHAGFDNDGQGVEVGPADDVLQRQPVNPLLEHPGELVRVRRRSYEQISLVLGEDAPRSTQPRHEFGPAGRRDRLISSGWSSVIERT